MRRPTPWVREECIQSDSLPAECDVVIVGGGLSGLACGRFLAAGGADVVVLEAEKRLGQGAVGRGNGLVHLGLCEHPIQLAEAIGNRDAEDVIRLSLRSIELLESSCSFLTEGGIWCASMDREAEGIERSTQWLLARNIACDSLTDSEVRARVGADFGVGRYHCQEGALDPVNLVIREARGAQSEGVRICTSHRVAAVEEHRDRYRVSGQDFSVDAEVVVYASGAWVADIEPWFHQKVFPARGQHLWEEKSSMGQISGRSQHGYVAWGPSGAGHVVSGCRWGSPHMELGEFSHELNPRISKHLGQFGRRFSKDAGENSKEWTSIMGFSCDGLPILGPLPGQPRKVACVGYNGQDLSFAMGCAEQVAKGLLHGGTGGISSRLQASRFVA